MLLREKILFTLAVLVLAAGPVAAGAAGPVADADEVALRTVAAYEQAGSISATVAVHGPGDREEEILIRAEPPDCFRADLLHPEYHDGVGVVVVRDGLLWKYWPPTADFPATRGATTDNLSNVPGTYLETAVSALRSMTVGAAWTAEHDGRPVYLLRTAAPADPRPFPSETEALRAMVDARSMEVLQVEGIDRDGAVVQIAEFRDMKTGVPLPEDTFAFTPPKSIWQRVPQVTGTPFLDLAFFLSHLLFFASDLAVVFHAWSYLGYRQISRENILENSTRRRIYEAVRSMPGAHMHLLSRFTGTNIGTLRYHLALLEDAGKIVAARTGGYVRYYENSGRYRENEMKVLGALRNEAKSRIISILLEEPELTRKEIATRLGISGPAVSRHLAQLCDDGTMEAGEDGRTVRYRLDARARTFLDDVLRGK
ncbi:winged helix-turn-helix transcriptional regulator [Methanofollis aquaemaris]|uniref:Winged helix-turn-helix transcriptional regulator n=1 Tax=Methanofollis aquaemaris TaxID=126734 RepID=A0A8A3S802_9EURY|nr:winged helix-turn-helix transcriptional regulator [Methanofollis aquaemaris]QSZ68255.1 winged helix-turn-helix transcriptional regulator [Methanofollis aquaemaris]